MTSGAGAGGGSAHGTGMSAPGSDPPSPARRSAGCARARGVWSWANARGHKALSSACERIVVMGNSVQHDMHKDARVEVFGKT
jgi:hypothetical protein